MASKEEINKAIVDSIGFPVPKLVDAIFHLDHPVGAPEVAREDMEPLKETRVLSAAETR